MAIYYIDPNWGGPFNGTAAEPYDDFTDVNIVANDSILIKRGTTVFEQIDSWFNIKSTTTRTVIGSYYNIDGSDDESQPRPIFDVNNTSNIQFSLNACENFTFENLEIKGGQDGWRIRDSGALNSSGHIIRNCLIHTMFRSGIYINEGQTDIQIYDNELYNCGSAAQTLGEIYCQSVTGTTQTNIRIHDNKCYKTNILDNLKRMGINIYPNGGSITDTEVYNNEVYNQATGGINIARDTYVKVYDNLVYDCLVFGIHFGGAGSYPDDVARGECYGNTVYNIRLDSLVGSSTPDCACILLDDMSDGVDVWGNYLYTSEETVIKFNAARNHKVHGNILVQDANGETFVECRNASIGNIFYNNTMYGSPTDYGINVTFTNTEIDIVNNILISTSNTAEGIRINTGNTLSTNSSNIIYGFTAMHGLDAETDTGDVNINPQLNADYTPYYTGPAYHAGITKIFNLKDYKGHKFNVPPTIGAYEFTSGSKAQPRSLAVTRSAANTRVDAETRLER